MVQDDGSREDESVTSKAHARNASQRRGPVMFLAVRSITSHLSAGGMKSGRCASFEPGSMKKGNTARKAVGVSIINPEQFERKHAIRVEFTKNKQDGSLCQTRKDRSAPEKDRDQCCVHHDERNFSKECPGGLLCGRANRNPISLHPTKASAYTKPIENEEEARTSSWAKVETLCREAKGSLPNLASVVADKF